MLTSISVLSVNGGHAIVGKPELAPTKPESALERPAIVTYTRDSSFALSSSIFRTSKGCLCAEAACCSHGIDMASKLSVIFFASGSSAV